MLTGVERLLFILLAVGLGSLGTWRLVRVARAIAAGRPERRRLNVTRALLDVLTQRTVSRRRPVVAALHAPLFLGFILYMLTNAVEIARGFGPVSLEGVGWRAHGLAVDLVSAAILLAMGALLLRRFAFGWMRFGSDVVLHERARAGMALDSAIVGGFILVHVGARLLLVAFGLAGAGSDPFQPAASAISLLLAGASPSLLSWGEHAAWWLAIGSILLFWSYLAGSKHLHLLAGPVKLAVRAEPPAALQPIDLDTQQPLGASRLEEMTWPRLLDAWACIQCLRCQDACPAHASGKPLSPAALLISERYELNRIYSLAASDRSASRPLLEVGLSEEAAWACTTCGACLEACPVGVEPMLHILDVRRHLAMEAARVPRAAHQVFDGLADLGHPFRGAAASRTAWMSGVEVAQMRAGAQVDLLYWVGCVAAFEPRAQKVARSFVRILHAAGLRAGVLGAEERCTGDPARRMGNEYVFQMLARENVDRLHRYGVRRIVTTCAHCYHTLKYEYPAFGGDFDVMHHTQLISRLWRAGRLRTQHLDAGKVTVHDPCYLGRHSGEFEAPRAALAAAGASITEMPRSGRNAFCCGAGGGRYWIDDGPGRRPSDLRLEEAQDTGAPTLATACPFCLLMFEDAAKRVGSAPQPRDVAEIVAEGLEFQE